MKIYSSGHFGKSSAFFVFICLFIYLFKGGGGGGGLKWYSEKKIGLSPVSLSVYILAPDLSFEDRACSYEQRKNTTVLYSKP